MQPLIIKGERIVMKTALILLLLVFGQFVYADDNFCEIQDYPNRGVMKEMSEYVLEQCQDGDVLQIVWSMGESNAIDLAGKHCKVGTIHSFRDGLLFCEFRKIAREVIRPSKKEWKQMKKNSKK